jgi:hypothetical protein
LIDLAVALAVAGPAEGFHLGQLIGRPILAQTLSSAQLAAHELLAEHAGAALHLLHAAVRVILLVYALLLSDGLEGSLLALHCRVVHPVAFEERPPPGGQSAPAVLQIILEHAFVVHALLVKLFAAPALLIVLKLAPVYPSRGEAQYALSVPFAIRKLSVVVVAIRPVVVSTAVGEVVPKRSGEYLSVLEPDGAVAAFDEPFELPLVSTALLGQHPEALYRVAVPLAHVGHIVLALPDAAPLLPPLLPLPVVGLPVAPLEASPPVASAAGEVAQVGGSVRVGLVPQALLLAVFEVPLEYLSTVVEYYALAFEGVLLELAEVHSFRHLYNGEVFLRYLLEYLEKWAIGAHDSIDIYLCL